jgi:glycosyltransferase involved in cell wall biosynthesis
VIVVDNASTDETRRVVEENAHGLDLQYVYEGRQGKNWACNAGYEHARAAYVAHLDADAKADSRWLENILRVIEAEQPYLIGGPLYPYYITAKPAWYLDRYSTDYRGDTAQYLPATI